MVRALFKLQLFRISRLMEYHLHVSAAFLGRCLVVYMPRATCLTLQMRFRSRSSARPSTIVMHLRPLRCKGKRFRTAGPEGKRATRDNTEAQ